MELLWIALSAGLVGFGVGLLFNQNRVLELKEELREAKKNDYSAYIRETSRNIEETVKLQAGILKLAQASEKYGLLFTSLPERKG